MGCFKLTYNQYDTALKVVHRDIDFEQNTVQRFLSLDPLMQKFPWMSPFVGFDNNPIYFVDPYGLSSQDGRKAQEKSENESEGGDGGQRSDPGPMGDRAGGSRKQLETEEKIPEVKQPIEYKSTNSPQWGSQKGFYVHQAANQVAIYGSTRDNTTSNYTVPTGKKPRYGDNEIMRKIVIDQLNKATEIADGDPYQEGRFAYRHAMSLPNKVIKAKSDADKFVRKQFKKARSLYKKGNYKDAYFQLGLALHTLQDATSPAHGGFQIWTGEENILEEAEHVIQELTYPGYDSNLQNVTDWFLNVFESGGELPAGNLFDNIKMDH